MIRKEEAFLAAHAAGDGWLSVYIEKNSLQIVNGRKYRRDRMRYVIGYSNTNFDLITLFRDNMLKIFGIRGIYSVTKKQITFKSKRVFDRLKELGGGNTYNWFISEKIFENKEIAKMWLIAFFDDEATVDEKSGRIRIKSMNKTGILQVKKLLDLFKIKSNITGPNCDKSFYITIKKKDIILYWSNINFFHNDKRIKLENCVNKIK